jgi:uncharacterized protein YjiS (DUF1127 family)
MTRPMTTCMSLTLPAADSGQAAGLVRRAWRAYWSWRARRVTVMILSSLDARTLRDIGITPGEFESLVQCHGDHRRRYDAGWLWRCGGR